MPQAATNDVRIMKWWKSCYILKYYNSTGKED
jgi:hypothetical protein